MTNLINTIAADTIANLDRNPHNYTVETLVANWEKHIEWLDLKVGGKAYNRELLSIAKNGWIATTQKTSTFIAPSEETISWGGFLGGEFVSTEEMQITAEQAFEIKFGEMLK